MHSEIECEWSLVTAPVWEPLSADDAKLHANISQSDEDALITAYITVARQAAESILGRAIASQTRKIQLSAFADVIWLPMAAPLQNDSTASPSTVPIVQYYDADGTLQTLADSYYLVDTTSEPGRIVRAPNQTWPTVQCDRMRPVVITYVCGWTDPDLVPEIIKQGMRLYVAGCDGDRVGETDKKAAESVWMSAGQVFWREPGCLY